MKDYKIGDKLKFSINGTELKNIPVTVVDVIRSNFDRTPIALEIEYANGATQQVSTLDEDYIFE